MYICIFVYITYVLLGGSYYLFRWNPSSEPWLVVCMNVEPIHLVKHFVMVFEAWVALPLKLLHLFVKLIAYRRSHRFAKVHVAAVGEHASRVLNVFVMCWAPRSSDRVIKNSWPGLL
jgi:hypothetical protein